MLCQVVKKFQIVMKPADTTDPSAKLIQQMANSANQTSETQQHFLNQIAQMQQMTMQHLQMKHYFKPEDATAVLHNVIIAPDGPSVYLPNDTILCAEHKGQLALSTHLLTKAQTAHVLEEIAESSLISLGQLCNNNCITALDKNAINIFKNDKCIITGTHNKRDGLWDIPLQPKEKETSESNTFHHSANFIMHKNQSKAELAEFFYGCCGSNKNGKFISWPGIKYFT